MVTEPQKGKSYEWRSPNGKAMGVKIVEVEYGPRISVGHVSPGTRTYPPVGESVAKTVTAVVLSGPHKDEVVPKIPKHELFEINEA